MLTISTNVSADTVARAKIVLTWASVADTLPTIEVSAEPLAVISPLNAISNESTEELTAVTAVALVTSSEEILVVKEVSAKPLAVISQINQVLMNLQKS